MLEAFAIGLIAIWLFAMISGVTLWFVWILLIVAVVLFVIRLVVGPGQRHSRQYVPTEVKDWKRERMDILQQHVDILGRKVTDKVTGFKGVAESVGFDLYGCVQVIVKPSTLSDKGEPLDGRWFDIQRLTFDDNSRVMPVPAFKALATVDGVHTKGPADKPVR